MKILIVYYFFPQFSFRNLHLGKYIVTVDGINIYVACVSWHFPLVLIWLFLWWFRVLAMFSTKLHLFWFSFVPSRAPICAKLRPNRSNSTLFSAMDGPQTSSIVRWTISKKRAQPFLPRLLWVENRPAINSRNVLEGVPDAVGVEVVVVTEIECIYPKPDFWKCHGWFEASKTQWFSSFFAIVFLYSYLTNY